MLRETRPDFRIVDNKWYINLDIKMEALREFVLDITHEGSVLNQNASITLLELAEEVTTHFDLTHIEN